MSGLSPGAPLGLDDRRRRPAPISPPVSTPLPRIVAALCALATQLAIAAPSPLHVQDCIDCPAGDPLMMVGETGLIMGTESLVIRDGLAYLAPSIYYTSSQMTIYSVEDPENPSFVGAALFEGKIIAVAGTSAYVAGYEGVWQIDVSNSTSPEIVAQISDDEAIDVAVDDT